MSQFRPVAKPEVDPLVREQLNIQRRRQQEEDRKLRIFDAKARSMGVDTTFLQQQVQERKTREQAQKEHDLAIEKEMVEYSKELNRLEIMKNQAKKVLNQQYAQYQATYQRKEMTREWDLNNPVRNRVTPALRSNGDDGLGPSSLQVLQGEDPQFQERKKTQQAQMRQWVAEQKNEKADQLQQLQQAEAEYATFVKEIDDLAAQHEERKRHIQAELRAHLAQENISLADQRKQVLQAEREAERQAELTELQHALSSDLLNETQPVSMLGAHRKVPYAFKGMTTDQKQSILDAQLQQQAQLQAARKQAKEEEQRQAQEAETYRKLALLKEREAQRNAKGVRLQVATEVAQQDLQKKQKYTHLYKEVYTNQPSEAYFSQFGTSSR